LADAKLYEGISKAEIKTLKTPEITLDLPKINRELGLNLTKADVKSLLLRLNYTIKDENKLTVSAPKYRYDINIHEDVVEEIARLYGYDEIPMIDLPVTNKGRLTPTQYRLRTLRHQLVELGLNEVV